LKAEELDFIKISIECSKKSCWRGFLVL